MNAEHITGLAEQITDLAATLEDQIGSVTMGEMADGSWRSYAIVNTYDPVNDLEQEFRITSPSSENAPAWASTSYPDWVTEVRVGSVWQRLSILA